MRTLSLSDATAVEGQAEPATLCSECGDAERSFSQGRVSGCERCAERRSRTLWRAKHLYWGFRGKEGLSKHGQLAGGRGAHPVRGPIQEKAGGWEHQLPGLNRRLCDGGL